MFNLNQLFSLTYFTNILALVKNVTKISELEPNDWWLLAVARTHLNIAFLSIIELNSQIDSNDRILNDLKVFNFETFVELLKKTFRSKPLKLEILTNKAELASKSLLPEMLTSIAVPISMSRFEAGLNGKNRRNRRQELSETIYSLYQKHKQSKSVYELKAKLRQKIYSLLSKTMREKMDIYLIGSSLTEMGGNSSDTDLCLIIYDSQNRIDPKYDDKTNVISKLEELSQIFATNGISVNPQVIPALVPILKFIDTGTGIEVNLNLNRTVTIRNTHLLHLYSKMDNRVAPLILAIKFWAQKNRINSAFNKSLTSYSISLMTIYFLQSVCTPPVVPCLQKDFSDIFDEDLTQLRLGDYTKVNFITNNTQELGELFTQFLQYFSLYYPFDKVISVRSGGLIDRSELVATYDNGNGKLWQWKCHICIEEPFDRTNTSHAVHDCQMFRKILHTFMDTYQTIKMGNLTLQNFL